MKAGIHPKVQHTKVTCTCGNSFTVLSDRETMSVDLCSACHPFYTGQQKFVDSAGRVDRFANRYAGMKKSMQEIAAVRGPKKVLTKLDFKFNPKEKKPATIEREPKDGKGKGDAKADAKPAGEKTEAKS